MPQLQVTRRKPHYVSTALKAFTVGLVSLWLSQGHAQIADPIPDPILPAGFDLVLHDFVQLPATNPEAPRARINMLREVDDGSGRLFVNDLAGLLYVVGHSEWDIYLNLRSEFPDFISAPGKGTGFGAFTFHPEFRNNGIFYTSHAEEANSAEADFSPVEFNTIALQWVVTEWTATDPNAEKFTGSHRELLRADFPAVLHGIQDIAFNPYIDSNDEDYGLLYICIGDGGSSRDFHEGNLIHPFSYLGTIFRIDPNGNNSANQQYGIPPDNPFIGVAGAVEETWAAGFRNPHRICWDPQNPQTMLIGDIGEMNIEEVNLGMKGHNYGWSEREGTFLYDRDSGRENVYPLPPEDSVYQFTYPVSMYDHDEGFAIVGGYIYRRADIAELSGKYLFGDIVNGRLFVIPADSVYGDTMPVPEEVFLKDRDGNNLDLSQLENNNRADLRFGYDLQGNIYILTKADGMVRTFYDPMTSVIRPISRQTELTIFPNPASSVLNVGFDGVGKEYTRVAVTDLQGRDVPVQISTHAQQLSIRIADLPQGIYNLVITVGDRTISEQFVIQNHLD